MVQDGLSKKQDPITKITRAERAGGMTEVEDGLLLKCKALSSNPSTTTTKKKRKKM
jgi:hypothetical protein